MHNHQKDPSAAESQLKLGISREKKLPVESKPFRGSNRTSVTSSGLGNELRRNEFYERLFLVEVRSFAGSIPDFAGSF